MPKRKLGLNKHQKAAFKPGERRVRKDEIENLIDLSRSEDVKDRLIAARNLCPCHVRTRIEAVWEALFRMLEDADVRVRRTAWHTLEDGGKPDDPVLDEIMDRADKTETDPQIRTYIRMFHGPRKRKEELVLKLSMKSEFDKRGKCDFCGRSDVPVKQDFETEIPDGGQLRLSLICKDCDRRQT